MTEKRFNFNINKNQIEYDGRFFAYINIVDAQRIVNKLNVFLMEKRDLEKENKELKQEVDELREAMKRLMADMMKP